MPPAQLEILRLLAKNYAQRAVDYTSDKFKKIDDGNGAHLGKFCPQNFNAEMDKKSTRFRRAGDVRLPSDDTY